MCFRLCIILACYASYEHKSLGWGYFGMICHNGFPAPAHMSYSYDDVIKWKHFPHYWPFVRGIHRSLVNYPHKGQWRVALMLSLIYAWINGWVNNRGAGDLRCHLPHYDVIVMYDKGIYVCFYEVITRIYLWSPNGTLCDISIYEKQKHLQALRIITVFIC